MVNLIYIIALHRRISKTTKKDSKHKHHWRGYYSREHLKRPHINETCLQIQTCWGPMRSSTWVGQSHGSSRFLPPAGVCSAVNPVSPHQPSVGHRWIPNKHGTPSKAFLMSKYGPAPNRNGANLRLKAYVWTMNTCCVTLLLLHTQNWLTRDLGCDCEGNQSFICLWHQHKFNVLIGAHKLGQKMTKKEI